MRLPKTLALLCLASSTACVKHPVPMTLGDGRTYQLIEMRRDEMKVTEVDGSSHLENTLVMRYYSQESDPILMREEATSTAGYLAPVADSLGCTVLIIEPSHAMFLQRLPIRIRSQHVRVERRGDEEWAVTKSW